MDYKTTLMALVLVSSALAGCTGDPDGGGNDEIDSDALQDLFDEHFEDFINNTTITVNNHYYNNTTYVVDDGDYSSTTNVDYNNTTNVDGGEINNYNNNTDNSVSNINGSGNGSGSVVQVFRTVWNPEDYVQRLNLGDIDLVIDGVVQMPSYSGGDLSYTYLGQPITLSLTCEEWYNAYTRMWDDMWRIWIVETYGGSHDAAYGISSSIDNDIHNLFNAAYYHCGSISQNYWRYTSHYAKVMEISIDEGEAIQFISLPSFHNMTMTCDDGLFLTSSNGTFSSGHDYIGGHANCVIKGYSEIQTRYMYNETYITVGNTTIDTPAWINATSTDYWWLFQSDEDYVSPHTFTDFLVYFRMHYVEVYELDSE